MGSFQIAVWTVWAQFAWLLLVIEQLAILAPGLLGASVARAARARGVAKRIIIWSRREETRREISRQDWCDAVADTPQTAVRDASLVVLAPPVDRIGELTRLIASSLPDAAIVTDVGSVKTAIAHTGQAALRPGTHFVASHPMAGSDKTGWVNASASLFEHRVCFVTPLPQTSAPAVEQVLAFWSSLGANPIKVDPEKHDEIVAHISHLPQMLASSLCSFLAQREPKWRDFSGGGLRDTTRIAGSDPQMWRPIFEQNREEILRALSQYQDELQAFHAALEKGDWNDLIARLERGRAYRQGFPQV
jgi:prephenate dehydrogenase